MSGSNLGGDKLQQAIGLGLVSHKLHNHLSDEVGLEDMFETNPNWFAFETRVRKMVLQMVEPQVKRSILERETIQEVKKQHDSIKKKIDECEFIIHKAQKKTASQEDVHKKIEFNETRQKIYEAKMKEAIDKLQHNQDVLTEKVDIVEQERSSFIMRVENLTFELKKFREDLIGTKEHLSDYIDKTHMELKKAISQFNNQIESVITDIQLEKKKLSIQSNDFKIFGSTIEKNNRRLQEIEELLQKALTDKLDTADFNLRISQLEKDIKMTQEQSFKVELNIRETNNYIDKYIPMHTQLMIDDTLTSMCVKKTTLLRNLFEYEKLKFKMLDDRIKGITSTQVITSPINQVNQGIQPNVSSSLNSNLLNLTKQASSSQYSPNLSMKQQPLTQIKNQYLPPSNNNQNGAAQQNAQVDRKNYVLPNFQVRELELQRSRNQSRSKKGDLRLSSASRFGQNTGGGLNIKNLTSDSSQGMINTMRRSDSNGSRVSKIRIKSTSKNKPRKTKIQNQQQLLDLQNEKLLLGASKQNKNIGSNMPVRAIHQFELDSQEESGNNQSQGNMNIHKQRSGMSLDSNRKVINQQLQNAGATDSQIKQNQNSSAGAVVIQQQANNTNNSSQHSQKSELNGIQQILELSEESMADSVNRSVQKRVKNIKSLKITEDGMHSLPKIDEGRNNNILEEDEETPSQSQQIHRVITSDRQNFMKGNPSGQSDLQYEELKNQATQDFIKQNPLMEGSMDIIGKTMQNYNQKVNSEEAIDIYNLEDQQLQDDQDFIDEEEDDDDEGDYSESDRDSDDSSEPAFELTASMIERIQRTEIREIDLEQPIRDKFTKYNEQLEDLRNRFPPEVSYHGFTTQVDELFRVMESVKSGVRVLAESIQQQFKDLGLQMQEDRDYYQTEMSANEKKRRREQFELMTKIDENKNYLRNVETQVKVLQSKDDYYQNICLSLIEVAKVDSALMSADEIDKKSISLMGVKEEQTRPLSPTTSQQTIQNQLSQQASIKTQKQANQQQQPVIQIEKSCMSCSSQPYRIISAFKMACLTYFPSMVQFQNSEFSREKMIQIKTKLLDELMSTLENKIQNQEFVERQILESRKNKHNIIINESLGVKENLQIKEGQIHLGILNNSNTEMLSLNSGTISQTEMNLERKIMTINDSERESREIKLQHRGSLPENLSKQNLLRESSQNQLRSYNRQSIKIQNIRQKTDLLWSDQNSNQNNLPSLSNSSFLNNIQSPLNNYQAMNFSSNVLNKTHNHTSKIKFEDNNQSQSVLLNPIIDKNLNKTIRQRNQSTAIHSSHVIPSDVMQQSQTPQSQNQSMSFSIKKKRSGKMMLLSDQNDQNDHQQKLRKHAGYIASAPISPSQLNSTGSSFLGNKRKMIQQQVRQANNSSNFAISTNASVNLNNSKILNSRLQ
eukprot:403371548